MISELLISNLKKRHHIPGICCHQSESWCSACKTEHHNLSAAATSEVRDNTPESQWVTQRLEHSWRSEGRREQIVKGCYPW